ncbi:sigma factor-like helix-turn-helix DNA-binding protein [Paenibacillus sp. TC-CSREp1]|uniref:sigma factor-like helix-turn-helix DNA-binding protein n=1 Tax=Paenibacillus sp. TC-CSREp1 TaxID=3410089 RepID=UPI003CFCBD73
MEMTKEMYSSELKKIAWRLQYRCKVSANKEFGMVYDIKSIESFENSSVSKLFVQDVLNLIDNEIGKRIIRAIYLEGKSEKEVAFELQISQQAVNKWKRKTLKKLSMKLSS